MPIEKDVRFWRSQISSAKDEQSSFNSSAKDANKIYSKSMSYNIFFSNVNVLTANLFTNLPKPDIQRRFLKKTEDDKLKYNTFLEVAKVTEGAVSFYCDVSDAQSEFKKTVFNSVKIGRGVTWVVYDPKIGGEEGNEQVIDRELYEDSLKYDEYLQSNANAKKNIWWKARRHLLSKEDLKTQYNYDAEDEELNFGKDEEDSTTAQKMAEVWEVWDKSEKKRQIFLQSSVNDEFLQSTEDPYGLENFFPCDDITYMTNGENVVPINEYEVYKQKAKVLDALSRKSDSLEKAIKLVITTTDANAKKTKEIATAQDGTVVSLSDTNVTGGSNVNNLVGAVPVDGALLIVNHLTAKKDEIKQDIFDVTGISDLARGQSNPNETATAQKIKGVFGSLRFQDRQKMIQNHVKNIYQIKTEIICEHWDAQTLEEITGTSLPTQEEKQEVKMSMAIQQNPQLAQQAQMAGLPVKQVTQSDVDMLDQPTWDEVLEIMKSDKLRNYTIDIESTSTVFDDKVAENASLQTTVDLYLGLVTQAAQLQDPNLIKGFLPLLKMSLTNTKAGRAVSTQLEEAIEGAYNGLLKEQQNPKPSAEDGKLQLEQGKMQLEQARFQAEQEDKQSRNQIDLMSAQNDSRKLALEEQKAQSELLLKQQGLQQDQAVSGANIANDSRKTDIAQQDANRKDRELVAETVIAAEEIRTGVEAPTISGDVASVG